MNHSVYVANAIALERKKSYFWLRHCRSRETPVILMYMALTVLALLISKPKLFDQAWPPGKSYVVVVVFVDPELIYLCSQTGKVKA